MERNLRDEEGVVFSRILVPVDVFDPWPRPLELALALARCGPGKVFLFSAVDDSFPNPDILSFQLPWADYYRQLEEETAARLGQLLKEVGAGPEEVEVAVRRGKPSRMIQRFAEEVAADLVVMATRAVPGLQQALLGSVTDRVIRLVACPVMVVRVQHRDPEPKE